MANATADNPVPSVALPFVLAALGVMGLMFAGMAVTFAVLRTTVSRTQLNVKYGLWGPSIDLARIQSVKVVDYEWTQFGGWGIRKGKGDTWAYVPGPGDVVEIEYLENGSKKTVQVGAQSARNLALEINRAREELTRERIDIASSDVDAEAEAAAVEEAVEAERQLTRPPSGSVDP